ncbi:hypothetical protein MA16_Dca021515 [Dendrobium catenatum]|uniref:Uncharacterized protein n=1 Tax=Dendrobium catenatum TaxID=906689 RepID=A0A2I0VQD8_9ASPA|nr:hypothetical protein MA16_Dca021515 [Dendrobium catenatum]
MVADLVVNGENTLKIVMDGAISTVVLDNVDQGEVGDNFVSTVDVVASLVSFLLVNDLVANKEACIDNANDVENVNIELANSLDSSLEATTPPLVDEIVNDLSCHPSNQLANTPQLDNLSSCLQHETMVDPINVNLVDHDGFVVSNKTTLFALPSPPISNVDDSALCSGDFLVDILVGHAMRKLIFCIIP